MKEPFGYMKAPPMLLLLSTAAQLVTFSICNIESKDTSICSPPSVKVPEGN